jgi:hypothetical protein
LINLLQYCDLVNELEITNAWDFKKYHPRKV